ncbi:MAG: adenosine deaminase [Anaerolineales bacterium]
MTNHKSAANAVVGVVVDTLATSPSQYELQQALTDLPKVDLHRHLEGSLRLRTLMEIARQEGLDLPQEESQLREQVQIGSAEPRTLPNFLSKFQALRPIYRSQEIIQRVIHEAIEDAAIDSIAYLELRFTPAALSQAKDFPLNEVIEWVIGFAREAARQYEIQIGLIASVNRHESVELAEAVAQIAADQAGNGIIGLDLAGNEVDFPADPFTSMFRSAEQAGLQTTVHAGEWSGADSVRQALTAMGASRIGHGVRVMEDPEVIAVARDSRAAFEVCLTSNLHSGVINGMDEHPLPEMINAGLVVTLNTDDPGISNVQLSDEYFTAVSELGLSEETLKGMILSGAQHSFLPKPEKKKLEDRLQETLGLGMKSDQ